MRQLHAAMSADVRLLNAIVATAAAAGVAAAAVGDCIRTVPKSQASRNPALGGAAGLECTCCNDGKGLQETRSTAQAQIGHQLSQQ